MNTAPRPVAVVTGISSGIGAAVAARLDSDGWLVAGLDLQVTNAFPTSQCDVSDHNAVTTAIAALQAKFGPIEAVVTAAGTWAETDPFVPDAALWRRLANVHLTGTVNVLKCVLPAMVARRRGRIVTITTDLALSGNKDDLYYVTLKGALLALTRSLAQELAHARIAVNTVAPGATDTPILPPDSPWRSREVLSRLPLPRLVAPEEIAEVTALLCAESCALSGQILSPNAGQAI